MNVARGLFRVWLIVMVIGLSVLACFTSCDRDYVTRYQFALFLMSAGAAVWALRGFGV